MNTKRITVELSEQEVHFLKQYAKVFESERNTDWTSDPIVLVQKAVRLPCPEENNNACGMLYFDPERELTWDTQEEAFENILEEYELNDAQQNILEVFFEGDYTNEFYTCNKPIFKGIDINVEKCWYQIQWQTVAYFLTIAEAKRYCKYQAHNLGQHRIYTENAGYANVGDYPTLTKTLLKMGETLIKEEAEFVNEKSEDEQDV